MMRYGHNLRRLSSLLTTSVETRRQRRILVIAICFCTIFVMLAIAFSYSHDLITKVRKVEPLGNLAPVRTDAVVQFAMTGTWPDKLISSGTNTELYLAVHYADHMVHSYEGNFAITYASMRKDSYTDHYRLVKVDELQPTLYWVCGYATPRADESVQTANRTNSPPQLLTHLCR